ncbi:MAG: hypothetical protein AAF583_01645 [Pseudomonadota bacterium]
MCVAVSTLAAIGSVVGGAVTAASTIIGGKASARAAEYNAQVQQNNAIIARQKADQERRKGDVDVVRKQREVAQIVGDQKVAFGAGGIELSTGSPLELLVSTVEQGALDAEIIRFNAETRERDLRFEADNLDSQSELTRASGRSARTGSIFGGLGTLLSNSSQAVSFFGS